MSIEAESNHVNFLEYKGKYKGLMGWLLSTDHKRIGLMYLYSMAVFFSVAAILGVLMKMELIAPGKTIMEAQTYNSFFTMLIKCLIIYII